MVDSPHKCFWTDNNQCICLQCEQHGKCPYTWQPEADIYEDCPEAGNLDCEGYIECLLTQERLKHKAPELCFDCCFEYGSLNCFGCKYGML